MITTRLFVTLGLGAVLAGTASMAMGAPALRGDVVVSSSVVTVGDMFSDAGPVAEQAMFRAPAPGSAGLVSLEAIRSAAERIGFKDYSVDGVAQVRVSRAGTVVDEAMLTDLITADLNNRGILPTGASVQPTFDKPIENLTAEAVATPVQLLSLRYLPAIGTFAAKFALAGTDLPVDVSGRMTLMIEAPHLVNNLPAGTILQPGDVEMRKVPLQLAETNGFADVEQLIGKQLQRQSRQGVMLRPADVRDAQLIARNDVVTVYFRAGAMTLTVKGQALNAASKGQDVSVLNSTTKKVLHGTALANGAVEITNAQLNVAGL